MMFVRLSLVQRSLPANSNDLSKQKGLSNSKNWVLWDVKNQVTNVYSFRKIKRNDV